MNPKYLTLAKTMAAVAPAGASRNAVATCGIAAFVGYSLPMPSGEVQSPDIWFNENCHALASQQVSELGEALICEAQRAFTMAKGIWFVRYTSAFNHFNASPTSSLDFFCTISRADYFVSAEDYALLTELKTPALALAKAIQEIQA
jgi:hypothetical protein